MDPISDFSAAPHLPYSLREHINLPDGTDVALSLQLSAREGANVVVRERDGEIHIDIVPA